MESGHLKKIDGESGNFIGLRECSDDFWSLFVGFWPLLKVDLATKKSVFMGFVGSLATYPLYFLFNCDKKIKYIE